jgi:hypothetical protein
MWRGLLGALVVTVVACGPTQGDGDPAGRDGAVVTVEPGGVVLTVPLGGTATQAYVATARFPDGTTEDVTADAVFTIDEAILGGFASATFQASGNAGGEGIVLATWHGASGTAPLTVRIEGVRVGDGAPADAAALFEATSQDSSRAPSIVYPSALTVFPPNLGDFEVHWTDASGNDLYEVALSSPWIDLKVYRAGPAGAGTWLAFTVEEWMAAGRSNRGKPLTVSVRGMSQAAPATSGRAEIGIRLTEDDVQGGLYYWAAAGGNEGIFRHDFGRPGEPAEPFYTVANSPGGRCVACHVLSRDGTRMAITFDGGNGAATILDVATRAPITPTDGSFSWNFATYSPDGAYLVSSFMGQLMLRDGAGQPLGAVPTMGWATHPDFAPSGDRLVYAKPNGPELDWVFTGGQIVVQPFDAVTRTFGAAQMIVPPGAENAYYPSFSPDGQWIVFNRSTEDTYDDASARIYVVKADGSQPPIALASPDLGGGLTNSWARWAPFAQTTRTDGVDEPLFWLTFSSKRVFGVRLPPGQPQIWMAPFFPARAVAGTDPSAPAFRLPFQDLATSNHIAQWTEIVVPIE